MCVCCQGVLRCKCGILDGNMYELEVGGFNLIWPFGVSGQGIVRCKCGIVIFIFVPCNSL